MTANLSENSLDLADLAGARVLLTGASGFIGRHLLTRLRDARADLVAVARRPPVDLAELARWRPLDLVDRVAVAQLVADFRPELVFHLASKVAGSRDLALVAETFDGNLVSTVNLATALAATGGCRAFVQAGSLEEPVDRSAPASPYAASKLAASFYLQLFETLYALPVVNARIFMVYGPGIQDEKKLVPYVIRTLLQGGEPKLMSGSRAVDWVFVGDVVEGLLRAALCPAARGLRIDLGSGRLTAVREVVATIYRQLAPERAPVFGGLADRPDEQIRIADVAATRALLGWAPGIDLEEGLGKTIADLRERGSAKESREGVLKG